MKYTSSTPNYEFILGSSSIYRKVILERILPSFQVMIADIDETASPTESPLDLVLRLSEAKAAAIFQKNKTFFTTPSSKNTEYILITSDQVATFNNQILGKPHTHKNAIHQLRQFSGNRITFFTSLTLWKISNTLPDRELSIVSNHTYETIDVYFRTLTDTEIETYLKKEQPYQCAGSFKSECSGILLLDQMHTNDPNALIGLPTIRLNQMLLKWNINLLQITTT